VISPPASDEQSAWKINTLSQGGKADTDVNPQADKEQKAQATPTCDLRVRHRGDCGLLYPHF
jgi:hypothetical protein